MQARRRIFEQKPRFAPRSFRAITFGEARQPHVLASISRHKCGMNYRVEAKMSAKERFLQDKSGAVSAEWVVMAAAALTICMVIATSLSGAV